MPGGTINPGEDMGRSFKTVALYNKYPEAVLAFEQVLLNYPDGDVVPEASYKRGLALDQLGETDRARQAFELVATNFPDSTMATLAQQALDRLSQP